VTTVRREYDNKKVFRYHEDDDDIQALDSARSSFSLALKGGENVLIVNLSWLSLRFAALLSGCLTNNFWFRVSGKEI